MITVGLQIALLALLLLLSFVFSGSETALFSLKSYQVRKLQSKPSRASIRVNSLLKEPYQLLVTILIGNTLVNVAASSIGTTVASRFLKQGVVGISVAVMTVLILIFGEIVPKTLAVSDPIRISSQTAPLISLAVRLFAPLGGMVDLVTRLTSRLGPARHPGRGPQPGEHVAEAIALGHSQGVLDRFEGEVLGGIFRLLRLSVQNIMTPRTEVFMLSSELTLAEAVSIVKSSGYSRTPVFDAQHRDTIIGVLYAKDLLYRQHSPDLKVTEIARKPVFVPESKPLTDLLEEFTRGAAHFAVVIDEYGSFSGIVTLDDILGEIVGREGDRHSEKFRYRRTARARWEVSGRMEVEYFNALIGTSIADPAVETVAGFLMHRLGRIPEVGEHLVVGNLRFRVLAADKRHIKRIEVEKVRK